MDAPQIPTNVVDDYSSTTTLIPFDRPVPLLRVPITADPPDDPFVLGFRHPISWASAYKACENQITQQCDAGARVGCSISASSKCALPWWKNLLGASKSDFEEREKCEEREMAACFEYAKANCRNLAKDKCFAAFRDARVVVNGGGNVNWRNASKLIGWACMREKSVGFDLWRFEGSWVEFKSRIGVRICKGSDLLGNYMGVNGN